MRLFFLLILLLPAACKSQPQGEFLHISEPQTEEIQFEEPLFEIVEIAIIQADLINTQFKATIKIDNPNLFAVDISSLSYELYANGDFWTSGVENNILHIPAQGSCETEFCFTMNFINMSRRLLDDIIAMRRVYYHFMGKANVQTSIPALPFFHTDFNRSGYSEVVKDP
jgi:LEA14-like dessication related protein